MPQSQNIIAGAGSGGPRILIVDDQPQSVTLMVMVMRHAYPDAKVFTAGNGADGLVIAGREALDVILLDAKMPGLDGLDVCRQLKADPKTAFVPVLLVSGVYTQPHDRVHGVESGADGYLCKPFEQAELVAQVQILLRIKRAEDELRSRLASQQSALAQSESRFRRLFEHSPDPVFVENEQGVVLDVNEAACLLHGVTRSDLVGRNVLDLVPAELRDLVARDYPKWFTGALREMEGLAYTRDGRRIPVDIRASRIEYDGQNAVLLHVRDISERKKAEEALQLSETRYRAIIEDQTDLVLRAGPDTTITFVNTAVERYLGKPRGEIIGDSYLVFVPEGDQVAMLALLRQLSPKNPTMTVEHRIKLSDGRIRWHQWVKRGLFNDAGALVEIQAVGRDITERLEIENRQKTMLRGMRAIVGVADELIAAPNETALFRLAVEFARSKLGLERAGILLNRDPWVQGTFGTDYAGRTTDERGKRMPMDRTWSEILRLRRSDEPRWTVSESKLVYWSGERMVGDRCGWVALTPIQTAHKPIGVFCNDAAITGTPLDESMQEVVAVYCSLLANIAERKVVEAERERLALAVDQSAESIVITDTKGEIQYVNAGFERVTGFRREDVMGKTPRILKSGKHGEAFYRRMWATVERGQVWTGRMTNRRCDGSTYEVEQTISPIRDAHGQIINFLCVAQDITTAVQMENELRQAQKMESIGRLAGGIAHDFNNLLTAILGFSRIVATEIGPDSPAREDVDEIIAAGERAARLTKQLLSFGRKQVIQVQPVSLNALVINMGKILRRTLGEHIELTTNLDPADGLIDADPGQIEQIVMNLAINAHDAMPKGGSLILTTCRTTLGDDFCHNHGNLRPGEYATFIVRDNGCGMADDVRERAFEPFFTTKEKGHGSGLGLATVYGIVKQSRGHIEMASEPGTGTVVTIHLPLSIGEMISKPVEAVPVIQGGTETVLIAEDEPIVRRLTIRYLQSLGYNVIEASNGEEAFELYQRAPDLIHLLLTDVIMPKLNGPDLAAKILKLNPSLRHVYMSGFAEDMLTRTIQSASAAALVLKPFSRETLARQVRLALDKPVGNAPKSPDETEH